MSILPTFSYSSYKDVRGNIFWWWVCVLLALWFILAKRVLPTAHREWIAKLAQDFCQRSPETA